METAKHADATYGELHTFADVKTMLGSIRTHQALRALNDAVNARFLRDRQQLTMTVADWDEWTALVEKKVVQFGHQDNGAPHGADQQHVLP